MLEKLREMKMAIELAEVDLTAFVNKGNDSAARRVRVTLSDVQKAAKELRRQIQDQRK